MHLFHKWSKWEPYVWQGKTGSLIWRDASNRPIMTDVTEYRQKRACTVCGLTQDREVRS